MYALKRHSIRRHLNRGKCCAGADPSIARRVYLRDFVKTDFDAVLAYSSIARHPYLFRTATATARGVYRGAAGFAAGAASTRFELAVEKACPAGHRRLRPVLHRAQCHRLGYMLGNADWGKGYATEIALTLVDAAFFDLRAERVISTVDVNNRASIRVLEKSACVGKRCFANTAAPRSLVGLHLFILAPSLGASRVDYAP